MENNDKVEEIKFTFDSYQDLLRRWRGAWIRADRRAAGVEDPPTLPPQQLLAGLGNFGQQQSAQQASLSILTGGIAASLLGGNQSWN